ncbi:MAG TPA: enoyl-CoA hydratase-related protein [Tepidisphaeraceae bacterium]|jgi:methylglutaconyl-CoA hydratase|nr:enoyl-CoA hydratase-related protein [Tepidisphaeraceae bacterium]
MLIINHDDPAIRVLTLNRPEKRNALSLALIDQITAAFLQVNGDPKARVIILAANGPAFCAGLDLNEAAIPGGAEKSAEALARMYEAIGNSPLITIAAASGAAMGGGAGLLAACDFVVAADDLTIAYPEVRRGLVAALVTCLLRRRLSDGAVRHLILLGENILPTKAREMNLVNDVVPKTRLMDEAMQWARDACAGAPGAIARSKRLLDELSARPLKDDLQLALQFHLSARNSAEAEEGIAAFREKREPKWGERDLGV